jgi:hypothetical protein
MSDENRGIMTIRYVNGTEQKFEYARFKDDSSSSSTASRIQDMLKTNQILLELEGRFLIIPLQNVLSIEVSPPPVKVPQNTLKDVRLIA